jgi:hypothetical protein
MNGRGRREKGSRAEIEVAGLLKAWWRPVEEAEFVRTPLSGGWGGKDLRSGFRASGDVMTTALRFPFVVEVKRREGWSWDPLKKGGKSPIWGYWKQAIDQAKEMGGIPLLLFRKNGEKWAAMLPMKAFCQAAVSIAPADHLCEWFPSELSSREASWEGEWVHPMTIAASGLLGTAPHVWTLVAPTFRRR